MMEDWQQHSLEEKGDLKHLLLTPSESYKNKRLNEYRWFSVTRFDYNGS